MRIIAGVARGTPLKVAGGAMARPYLEKTRGAIFNSLTSRIPEARVLDLYAGSGAVGIEALSRGAESCVFIEAEQKSIDAIKQNLDKAKLTEYSELHCTRVERFLAACSTDKKFDLIFIDPPFPDVCRWDELSDAREIMINAKNLLEQDGRIVFRYEHRKLDCPEWEGLKLLKDKRYGRSRVLFYTKKNDE